VPSSGARSGTKPNRPSAAGDGSIGRGVELKCGHVADGEEITRYPGGRRVYRCPEGCGLIDAKRKR